MPESDSTIRSYVNGDSSTLSPDADLIQAKDLARRGREPLKLCRAGQVKRLVLLSVGLATVPLILVWYTVNRRDSQDASADIPGSAIGLAVFLRDKLPEARIVSTRADGQIDRSFLLTVGGSDEDTLRALPRAADRAGQWRGTVLCEWLVSWEPAELFLEQWGEYAFARPPFLFFGDKELLARIKEILR